jgi:hypothetical protein
MLPWLGTVEIDRFLEVARHFEDDYSQEEAIVFVLPRLADLRGIDAALAARSGVVRPDWEAASWAAVWPWLPPTLRTEILPTLMPSNPMQGAHEAQAIGKIAEFLRDDELSHSAQWLAASYPGDFAHLIQPVIRAAARRSRKTGFQVWQAVAAQGVRRPRSDALAFLAVMIPLADRLGGQRALSGIDEVIRRTTEWWP